MSFRKKCQFKKKKKVEPSLEPDSTKRDRKRKSQQQRAALVQAESDAKLLQTKTEKVERFRKRQIHKQIAAEKLAALKEQQATSVSQAEESCVKDVVKRQNERAKQLKKKEEKKTQCFGLFLPTDIIQFLRKQKNR